MLRVGRNVIREMVSVRYGVYCMPTEVVRSLVAQSKALLNGSLAIVAAQISTTSKICLFHVAERVHKMFYHPSSSGYSANFNKMKTQAPICSLREADDERGLQMHL